MISKQLRSQFSILLYFQEAATHQEIKAELFEKGYDTFAFVDQSLLLSRIAEAAPHIVVFDLAALEDPIHIFIEKVLEVNQEILFVCIASDHQAKELQELQEYNIESLVSPGENLPVRIGWVLDQICQGLIRLYQNERLINDKQELEKSYHRLEEQFQILSREKSAPPIEVPFKERLAYYNSVESKDDVIQSFFKSLPVRALFFKFLPTVNSFVATLAKGIDIETLKGVGCRLKPDEIPHLLKMIEGGVMPAAMQDLVVNGLKANKFTMKPVLATKNIDGVIVMWGDGILNTTLIENLYLIFTLKYQEVHLLKRSENFDTFDSLTELYNGNYYLRKIEEEISRSKRIHRAVSVLRIKIDAFEEILEQIGNSNRDLIVRTIAGIIKKTSRINDISSYLGEGQFGLILVHCARKGAALRGERLRRIIEGHSFAMNDLKVTVSTGVSEYPTFVATPKELDDSAFKALEFIMSKGGNKVCLFKPSDNFKPDFVVEAI